MALSFADTLAAAQQMVTALTANQAQVAARGITADFVTRGQGMVTRLEELNSDQERLKAELKQKTAELDKILKDMTDWNSEAVSAVKLAYRGQQEKWIEFGIKAKR